MNWHICQLTVVKTFLFLNPYLPEFSEPQNKSQKDACDLTCDPISEGNTL